MYFPETATNLFGITDFLNFSNSMTFISGLSSAYSWSSSLDMIKFLPYFLDIVLIFCLPIYFISAQPV